MGKKVTTTVYITEDQQRALRLLHDRSKVPVAEYIRQGIDLILNKYQDLLPGQMEFGALPNGQKPDALTIEELRTP
ncbi:MAG: ribbon-helix-helix domain-containing protein [Pseudobdellovibrionaceae bacterium]|nr:ribbon-helix-helix domain-containing protein [Bdellovibrionales bacterium]USN47441.1 MAG: ribbon-helix-helix domain-containing protein [Pseudobdellovibrionaceae bacterium]